MDFRQVHVGGATALLHALWQCAVLAAIADATLRRLDRRSAALRHGVGMGFLVSMLLAPAWMFLRSVSPAIDRSSVDLQNATRLEPFAPTSDVLGQALREWAAPLCVIWMLGVVSMLARHAGGLWWLSRLDRRAVRGMPPEWIGRMQALQHAMGISRAIVVRLADEVLVPFTARLLRPIIWIPASLLTRLPQAQIEALLAHELAHIRRLDWLWNGLQCVIEALLFFHPGVWWLSRRVREERELACDAMAASVCADPVALAEALASMARVQPPRPRLILAADDSPLHGRIVCLLSDRSAPVRSASPTALISLLLTGALLVLPNDARLPNVLPQRDATPTMGGRAAPTLPHQAQAITVGSDYRPRATQPARAPRERTVPDAESLARAAERASRAEEAVARVEANAAALQAAAARENADAARVAEGAARTWAEVGSEIPQPAQMERRDVQPVAPDSTGRVPGVRGAGRPIDGPLRDPLN